MQQYWISNTFKIKPREVQRTDWYRHDVKISNKETTSTTV